MLMCPYGELRYTVTRNNRSASREHKPVFRISLHVFISCYRVSRLAVGYVMEFHVLSLQYGGVLWD